MSFPLMWFTSSTPTTVGQRQCAFARFLGFHAGVHGTGYKRRSLSVPLATGSGVHDGLELIGSWIMEYQAAHGGATPPQWPEHHLDVVAWAATEAAARYEAKARARAFTEEVGEASLVNTLILEQRTLIEAQVWVAAIAWMPNILANARIIDVEREETLVRDCTCGLGDAVSWWAFHDQRGCTGIVAQARADWITEAFVDAALVNHNFKTKASPNMPWEKAFEDSGQVLIEMETASRRLGKPVNTAFVPVLFKGWRGRDRDDPDGPKYQHSKLLQGYFDPGSPGIRPSNWACQYKWYDDYGKGHTLPRLYQRQSIWDEAFDLPPCRPGASRVETWVTQHVPNTCWGELLKVLGPFPRAQARLPMALAAIDAEEWKWRADVEELRATGDFSMTNPLLEQLISRSWACHHYDGSECDFFGVCHREPGWQDPGSMAKLMIRTPHHAQEREACEAAGLPAGMQFEDPDEEFADAGD